MVFATETSEIPRIQIKPEALVSLPVGVASPLWGFYATAALSGVAYWWMTQWTRPVNLEALFGKAAPTLPAVVPAVEAAEAVVEKIADTVVETLTPPELPVAPVGGEAAPISPAAAIETVAEATEEAIETTTKTAPEAAAEVAETVSDAAEKTVKATTKAAEEAVAAAKPESKPAPEPRSVAPKAKAAPEAPRSA